MFTPRKKKTLKEIKDLNKGKRMICLWIRRVNIAKGEQHSLPKIIYKFKVTLNKIPAGFLAESEKHSKIHMEIQGTQSSQNNLEELSWRSSKCPISNLLQNCSYQNNSVLK